MFVEAKKIGKRYGQHVAVRGIDLQFERGSFNAILGPNGAGKSTTISMLIGLTQPSMGEVIYESGVKIGVVFQSSVLDAALTVWENLIIRAKQYKNLDEKRVPLLVEQLGLTAFQDQAYGTLSGGQKRRVDIARALLPKPDILFLDEPTTGLDIQTRKSIWELLYQLQKNEGMTIVLTTHYLDEADEADQIYIVDHGQIIAQGSASQIKSQYAQNILKIRFCDEKSKDELEREGVLLSQEGRREFVLHPQTEQDAIQFLFDYRDEIVHFEFRPGTMDDAFIALTGREVR